MARNNSEYRGFSSRGSRGSVSIVKTGIDLIKADLVTTFDTPLYSNRMRPLFGSTLKQKVFEQYGSSDRSDLIAEVERVVQLDPRLTYVDTVITDIPYGIIIAVNLINKDTGTPFSLRMDFNTSSAALYGFSAS